MRGFHISMWLHRHLCRCCCFLGLNLYFYLVLLSLGLSGRILVAKNWFASLIDSSQKLSVPFFIRHPFGCLVQCLFVGYLLVSLGLAVLLDRLESFMTYCLLFVCTFYVVIFVLSILLRADLLFSILILISSLICLGKKKKKTLWSYRWQMKL